jgi:putative N6-adenine-specific DNA methylase
MATITHRKPSEPVSQHYYATCPKGLSQALGEELASLGAREVRADPAGVAFEGPIEVAYTANLHSRIATRILWRVSRFDYRTEQDIYDGAKNVRWHAFFGVQRTFRIDTTAVKSPVKSLDFITLRVKDAIADSFRDALQKRPSVESREPDIRVAVFLDAKWCTLYFDLSGEPLFKRGRRDHVGEAPLKKNLAAGILHLSGWKPGTALLDPMCGAGTFLTEAAEMSLGYAPGRGRTFGFEKLSNFNEAAWDRIRAAARANEKPVVPLQLFGSDLYGRSLDDAKNNLLDAGLEATTQLKQANVLEMSAPADSGVIVTNPPYGIRIGEKEKLDRFYPELGNLLKQKFSGWTAYIISGDPDLPRLIRLAASKRTVLYNGALECRLYEYRMVEGGNRK